jgi:hypothetical protein
MPTKAVAIAVALTVTSCAGYDHKDILSNLRALGDEVEEVCIKRKGEEGYVCVTRRGDRPLPSGRPAHAGSSTEAK